MASGRIVELLEQISEDIHAVRGHTTRLVRDLYRRDLERVASTPERQEMWRLCDGTLSSKKIANKVGVSVRTVQYFLNEARKAGLIAFLRRGYPKRTDDFDVIPPEWKPYKGHQVSKEQPPSQLSREAVSQ